MNKNGEDHGGSGCGGGQGGYQDRGDGDCFGDQGGGQGGYQRRGSSYHNNNGYQNNGYQSYNQNNAPNFPQQNTTYHGQNDGSNSGENYD